MCKKSLSISVLLYFLFSIFIFTFSYNYIKDKEEKLLDEKFTLISKNMKKSLSSLIADKKNATLAIALSAAKDFQIKNLILNNDNSKVNLNKFSLKLRNETLFKNVWFQILDNKGISLYRSWTKDIKDSMLFRADVRKVLKERTSLASISVGKYDMTFKSIVPIFDKKKFIGIFEVITHFNSVSKSLEEDKIDSIMFADKRFKDNLVKPFTNKFIDDYYIANLNAKDSLIKLIKEENIKEILKIKNYKLIQNNILTTLELIELDDRVIGYVILAKNINNINKKDIESLTQTNLTYVVIFIILLGLLFIMFSYYLYSRNIKNLNNQLELNLEEIKLQEKEKQSILDSQKNIIVITDGKTLINANEQLVKFYEEFTSIEKFKEKYKCICETFIEIEDDDSYVIEKDYNGKNWAEHILANSNHKFKAAILKNKLIHHFTVNVTAKQFKNEIEPFIIVTLTDITYEIEQNIKIKDLNENLENIVEKKTKELQELNETLEQKIEEEILKSKDKDRILFQQSKMASMGEMLENIAHQWRQPLNAIATSASTLKLQKDLDLIDDEQIDTSCDYILNNTYYLSQTIEDFKSFFKQDKEKQEFLLAESINEDLNLLKDKLNHNSIQVIVNIDENTKIFGYKNEFQQAILNILNNSIDAFNLKDIKSERIILIDFHKDTLEIKDSAEGVDEKILNKIFEPYFTTKHQSQGTGIGLYMTEEILIRHMNCSVKTNNINFEYKHKNLKGLRFLITFNQY